MKNKNKKWVYMTQKRKKIIARRKDFVLLSAIMIGAAVIGISGQITLSATEPAIAEINIPEKPKFEFIEVKSETIREVTAYNAGDPAQTDSSPCIGASMKDICKMLEQGKKVCAANFVPFGTRLFIEGYGECEVWDTMNSRFLNRVDIAMKKGEKNRAVGFGLQKLNVRILK